MSKPILKSGETDDGGSIYTTYPPEPEDGHWMGYYLEMAFNGDTHQSPTRYKN